MKASIEFLEMPPDYYYKYGVLRLGSRHSDWSNRDLYEASGTVVIWGKYATMKGFCSKIKFSKAQAVAVYIALYKAGVRYYQWERNTHKVPCVDVKEQLTINGVNVNEL